MLYGFIKDGVCINTGVFNKEPSESFVKSCGADSVVPCPDGYGRNDYFNGQWSKNLVLLAEAWRVQRDAMLNETDVVYCNAELWESYSAEKKAEWRAYKQALRDVTKQADFPLKVEWPTRPEAS